MFTKIKGIKLKKSEKRAIKLALVVVLFVILFNLIIYPLYQSKNKLQRDKVKYTKDLNLISKKIKEAKILLKQAKALRRKYKTSINKFIQSKNIELAQVFLEETVTDYAKKRDLQIQRIYKERARDEHGFKVVKARITVRGDFDNIIDFLYDLEKDEHFMYAESIILRFYRGLEAVVSVKGIIRLTPNAPDKTVHKKKGGKK